MQKSTSTQSSTAASRVQVFQYTGNNRLVIRNAKSSAIQNSEGMPEAEQYNIYRVVNAAMDAAIASGKLTPMVSTLTTKHRQEYTDSTGTVSLIPDGNGRIGVQVTGQFTGVIRVSRINIDNQPVPYSYDTVEFVRGLKVAEVRQEKDLDGKATISQLGRVRDTSLGRSQLGSLAPTFTPSVIRPLGQRLRKI